MDVAEDVAGTAAVFGDDIAITCLASMLGRAIIVIQARPRHPCASPRAAACAIPGERGLLGFGVFIDRKTRSSTKSGSKERSGPAPSLKP